MAKFLLLLCCICGLKASAQFNRYIVKFTNKGGTPHTIGNPNTYLSTRAIARRTKYNIAIDSTDLPITPRYLDSIRTIPGVTILNYSKWLNQVAIRVANNPNAIAKINSFPFVQSTNGIATRLYTGYATSINANKLSITENPINTFRNTNAVARTQLNYGNSFNQINMHNGQFLHDYGFLGNGMHIAVMDAGFNSHLTNVGIDSLRINNQIKETYDYVANEASVNEDDAHGFYCLSILGANKPGIMIGSAPKANYYLYRTEDVSSEYPIEEQNWIAAAERADSIGIDVFSTSLGYLDFDDPIFDYSYPQRNGNIAMMTRAGDLAARKGILVCNSAGNNGNGNPNFVDYKYVAVPADGDSIIAMGSCNASSNIASSSAWGPTSSGAIKPNLTSLGQGASFINLSGTASNGNGTSFSNPNMAGLLSGLWQAFPELNNIAIRDITQESAHLFSTPDGRFGYGIPNMKKAFVLGLKRVYTQTPSITTCLVTVPITVKDNGNSTYVLERKLPAVVNFVPVQTINASSGAFAQKNYILRDTLPAANTGLVTYRIKHTMSTDTSFYYNDFTVNYNAPCATPVIPVNSYNISLSPNPIGTQFTLQLGSLISREVTVQVYDALGKRVWYKKYTNQQSIIVPSNHWQSGNYTVEVWNNKEKVYLKRVIK